MNAKYLLLGTLGLGLMTVTWWFVKDNFLTEKPLSYHLLQPVPGPVEFFYDKLLLLRKETANGPLLLKVLNEDLVVRYRFDTHQMERAEVADWHGATERIKVCGEEFGIPEEDETGKYNTYGKYARLAAYSNDQSKFAIISAAGPKGPSISLFPGLGGGPAIYGSRYLEVKGGDQPFVNLRGPIRVVDDSGMGLCWTDEEDTLVYFSRYTFSFSILRVADSTPALPSAQAPPDRPRAPAVEHKKPDLSGFTGKFRDYGIDKDRDGRYEKVAVEVETETAMPGRYKIFLRLESSNGSTVVQDAETELKGGIETTKIIFDAGDWFKKGIEGELLLTFAQLHYGDGPMLEMRENIGRTQLYSSGLLGRPNVVFTGNNKIVPIDVNNNGKFEGLDLYLGVNVLESGEYSYSGDLYDNLQIKGASQLVEGVRGKVNLATGDNAVKFRFTSENIIKRGGSSVYRLRFVFLRKDGKSSPFLDEAMRTEPFDVSQFEAASASRRVRAASQIEE